VAPPSLVWNVSIGQSTLATQRVLANLYYRGLVLRRQPRIGDTLETSTRVTGLRQNTPRPGLPATGLAALRITTRDQQGAIVLDYERCAMIPLRDPALATGWHDDLAAGHREIGAPSRRPPARSRTCSPSSRGSPATTRRRCTRVTCCRARSRLSG
jgi:hypothetical protein